MLEEMSGGLGVDDDAALGFGAFARRGHAAGLRHQVMHQLALIRIHRIKTDRFPRLADLGNRLAAPVTQLLDMAGAISLDVDADA